MAHPGLGPASPDVELCPFSPELPAVEEVTIGLDPFLCAKVGIDYVLVGCKAAGKCGGFSRMTHAVGGSGSAPLVRGVLLGSKRLMHGSFRKR